MRFIYSLDLNLHSGPQTSEIVEHLPLLDTGSTQDCEKGALQY